MGGGGKKLLYARSSFGIILFANYNYRDVLQGSKLCLFRSQKKRGELGKIAQADSSII